MTSSHTNAASTGFLAVWFIETLILVYFLVSIIAGLMIKFTIGTTRVIGASSTALAAYLPTQRLCTEFSCWLRSSYRSAQARLKAHRRGVQTCERLLRWHKKSYREIQAISLEGRAQTDMFLTRVTLCITHNINSIRTWVGNLIISICLWILEKQNWEAHRAVDKDRIALPCLQLIDDYQLQIPTTEIHGVLNTATIHKAYHILLTSSLKFCQLKPAMRSAIIYRIVHDILNYDNAMGHIWSQTNTFALAAQIVQYQLSADWFDKPLQLQLADTGVKLGGDDSDITAAFVSTVFLVNCDFPTPGGSGVGATKFPKEPMGTNHKAAHSVACPTSGPPRPASQRIRNSLLPGYSRQWHAAIRE